MIHHLFYFGVLLPTLVVILCFLIFLICWFKCHLRERFLTRPKFQGGSHNSTQTSLVSATSNCPPGRDYWDVERQQGIRMFRSETQQTSLCTSSKYVPGHFPGCEDDDWRYMSRNSINKCRQGDGKVWTTKFDSDSSLDSRADPRKEAELTILSRHARTNYALLDDDSATVHCGSICVPDENNSTMVHHQVQIAPRYMAPDWCSSPHDDLSPISDEDFCKSEADNSPSDRHTSDLSPSDWSQSERPPRDDDFRDSSQLNFVSGSYRTNLNGYRHLSPVGGSTNIPYQEGGDNHQRHQCGHLKLDANDLTVKMAANGRRYQCLPYASTDIRAPVIRV